MTKNELVRTMSERTGLTLRQTEEVIYTLVDIVETNLAEGKKVQITGFGTFVLNNRKARHGVDPINGKDIYIPEMVMPHFRAGSHLTQTVRGAARATELAHG